ncbi:MAG: FAD-binding and (Fe-S)-binding domain-containing protein [Acidimicrobiales bacterium]
MSELAADLRAAVSGEVRFDTQAKALWSTDASNYRQEPIGVVLPRNGDDVVAAIGVCRRHGVPIVSRGGGTGLAGQTCNHAVVIDMSRHLTRVESCDSDRRLAVVEPGVVLDDLKRMAERSGLTFGPDPATHDRCTLGGMIGNNSCGVHSIMAGKTADNIESLDVVLYDGTCLTLGRGDDAVSGGGNRGAALSDGLRRFARQWSDRIVAGYPKLPRRVSGYNLEELLADHGFDVAKAVVGSEGTCVTVLKATVRLVDWPAHRVLVVVGYDDVVAAADAVTEVAACKPIGLEGMDEHVIEAMRRRRIHPEAIEALPSGRGWLLVEFGSDQLDEAKDRAQQLARQVPKRRVGVFVDPARQAKVWRAREAGLGATTLVPGEAMAWAGWEDSAVPPDRLAPYLRDLRALMDSFGYRGAFYGHFGDGCVHTRVSYDLTSAPGIARYRDFVEQAADLVVGYGGSLSGEHGDGQARGELLARMFGPDLVRAMEEFKALWDPDDKMNPGKVVRPRRLDEDLRLGTGWTPIPVRPVFTFADDGGDFASATLRCVGVGKCRRHSGEVMCPSYMVTGDETHSTRGRAHLLFEMMRGEVITDGWRSTEVKDALDLCLSCKGCKSDCPVNVDMATYKAEFLSHHYQGRLRPRASYAMGLIPFWLQGAAPVARWLNRAVQLPGVARVAKAAGGIDQAREIPRLAATTFRSHARGRARPPGDETAPLGRVVLWPDTFTDHFAPEIGLAAVQVLEAAGYEVAVPNRWVCCGRPLYDYGMLGVAARLLRRTLDVLAKDIERGTPVVVLEPSCAATFRDELPNLLGHDARAARLASQTVLLSELLDRTEGWRPPRLQGSALVQRHCHHHAVFGFEAERRVLDASGLDVEVLDSGCCGMAGSFGFEAGARHEVSVACGERVLFPAVRAADPDVLVLADGFSCRQQIRQGTGRRARHLAEVITPDPTSGWSSDRPNDPTSG